MREGWMVECKWRIIIKERGRERKQKIIESKYKQTISLPGTSTKSIHALILSLFATGFRIH